MNIDIKVPQLPASVTEANILQIFVSDGLEVSKDQMLFEIETDKVVLEVVAPADGIIQNILINPGDSVSSEQLTMHLANVESVETPLSTDELDEIALNQHHESVDSEDASKAPEGTDKTGLMFGAVAVVLCATLIVYSVLK